MKTISSFHVFAIGLILSFVLITTWNLNHVFHWIQSGDKLYGTGFGIILLSCAFHIHCTTKNGLRRILTTFFLYCSVNNLLDELLFNPYIVNWYEYASALIITPLIYHFGKLFNNTREIRD